MAENDGNPKRVAKTYTFAEHALQFFQSVADDTGLLDKFDMVPLAVSWLFDQLKPLKEGGYIEIRNSNGEVERVIDLSTLKEMADQITGRHMLRDLMDESPESGEG